jgi:hypothetical protein
MNRDHYIEFVSAKGNSAFVVFAWAGAILSPLFVIGGLGGPDTSQVYIGLALAIIPLLAIGYGVKALARSCASDFVVYTVLTVTIFCVAATHMYYQPLFWFGNT